MTIDEFIVRLARLRHRTTKKRPPWHLGKSWNGWGDHYEGIRIDLNTIPYCYCPITAVARAEGLGRFSLVHFRRAGEAIGLKEEDIELIGKAADLTTPTPLRLRLLDACGL